ncbi:MAG: alpha/beta fold hydrolase [Pseudonocardiaceae bacterium]
MNTVLHKVRSKDGTSIAYEEFGAGPPLVLVHGGISDRTYWAPIVPALAQRCTVLTVDRRGRGASGDAASYAIDREFEDVAAVVDAIDEPVHLLGHSYGGICALEAALRTENLVTLVLYEPALVLNGAAGIPASFIEQLEALVAAGERDRATELMMSEIVGLPAEVLAELRADAAAWQPMVDCVHTLPRELRSVSAFVFDAARYRALDVPTVLLAGTDSPPELHVGVGLVHDAVDGARVVTMHGVDHEAVTTGPDVLTATLMDLLGRIES